MILGVGNDLCDIRRIEKVLSLFGRRFLSRVFTTEEQVYAQSHSRPAATLAKRFAAKEACAKALGTGFSNGVIFRSIGVINKVGGQPALVLTGRAAIRLDELTPGGKTARIHLALTDDYPLAQAFVVIEALGMKQ